MTETIWVGIEKICEALIYKFSGHSIYALEDSRRAEIVIAMLVVFFLALLILLILVACIAETIKLRSKKRIYEKYCADFNQDSLLMENRYIGRKYALKKDVIKRKIRFRLIAILLIGIAIAWLLVSMKLTSGILEKSLLLYVLATMALYLGGIGLLCVLLYFVIFNWSYYLLGKVATAALFIKLFIMKLVGIREEKSKMRIVKVKKDGVKYE